MDPIIIYTDGGCSGNPGPGGWAFILVSTGYIDGKTGGQSDDQRQTGSGGCKDTTNNRMELTAVIRALSKVLEDNSLKSRTVELHTDSQYVKNGITSWINNWIKNGWKTAAKKPVKNKELWIMLKEVSDQLDIKWKWVKGHAGNPLNEACDTMVQEEMMKL